MATQRMLMGISGNSASGKDEVGRMLSENHGYTHASCSDYLRSYISLHQLGFPDRDTCTRVARELRALKGATFLVDQCLNQYSEFERLALSGIYSPAEAIKIKRVGGQILHVVCRNEHVRYDRIVNRGQFRDGVSFEEFQIAQRKENTGNHDQQDVETIAELADYVIFNEGTFEQLAIQVSKSQSQITTGGLDALSRNIAARR